MSMPFILQFNQLSPLKNAEEVERFALAFEELDYNLTAIHVHSNIAFDQGSLNIDRLNFSDSFRDALPVAYQYRNLSFEALHQYNELELLFSVAWNPPYDPDVAMLYASTYQRIFLSEGNPDKPEFDAVYYGRQVIDLGKALYAATSPKFGWAEYGPPDMSPSPEEVDTFQVFDQSEGVFWANFFSPAFVQRIGPQRLTQPPIGWSEPLQDGGMLYVVAPTYFGEDLGKDRGRMRQYFHL